MTTVKRFIVKAIEYFFLDAAAFGITTLGKMTLSMSKISAMTHIIMTLSITPLRIMTLSIMELA